MQNSTHSTKKVLNAINWASDLGCSFTNDRVLQNQTRITNRMGWITSLSGIIIATFLCTTETPVLGLSYLYFISFLMLIPVYLNSLGKHKAARLTYVLIANMIVASLSIVFGKASHFQYFFFTLVGIPLIFFTYSKSKIKWFFSIGAVANWIAVEIYFMHLPSLIDLGPELSEVFRWLSNGLQFILIAFMFYFFANESERFVNDLKTQKDKLLKSNTSLDDALEKSQAATRAKSMFLANMSHEIRTPLNGIIVASDLLGDSEMNKRQVDLSQIISTSSKSLLSIVNDILDLSKAEANKLELNETVFKIDQLVDDTLAVHQHQAMEKGLELIGEVCCALKKYYLGDEEKIKQVLNNLIGNAVKFCKSGYIKLTISEGKPLNKRIQLKFSIEDSGIGISKDKIEEIFESFTQEDGSTSRKYGGTGLGTTISKMLVERMNGTISAESPNPNNHLTEDPGSLFSFTILVSETENVQSYCPTNLLFGKTVGIAIEHAAGAYFVQKTVEQAKGKVRLSKTSQGLKKLIDEGELDLVITEDSFLEEPLLSADVLAVLIPSSPNTELSRLASHKNAVVLQRPLSTHLILQSVIPKESPKAENGFQNVVFNQDLFKGTRILLAEDNPINQEVAKQLFHSMGCEVAIAADGLEALELLEKQEFDLIFMDHMMPNMDGIEATQKLRSKDIQLPVIAMTANTLSEDRISYKEAGMNDYISKPVIKAKLVEIIKMWLTR